ncbi:p53-like transcription factor [Penicillium sp. IBT 35674x]|nr:p53-like transcription factor [Penicillium sp. IBT 35674x]
MSAKSDPEDTSQSVSLNIKYSEQVGSNNLAFLFAWPRFQFRHATNKNMQQKVLFGLIATLSTGVKITVAQTTSSPSLIVRGRHPKKQWPREEQNPDLAQADQGRGRCRDRQVQRKILDLDEQDEQD